MSACSSTVTARSCFWRAVAKDSWTTVSAFAIRAFSAATCSGVAVVLPRPAHGCRPSLLPTTWTSAKSTPWRRSWTFSGNPAAACESTFVGCWPSDQPGCAKKIDRSYASRSSGLYAPLFARWQSVHSLSPGV